MIHNYFVIGVRNLIRNKSFSVINIFGLALGMAACTLILYFVSFEAGFDSFHDHADRLYRVNLRRYNKGILSYTSAMNVPNTADALTEAFPEIEEATRLYSLRSNFTCTLSGETRHGETQTFNEKNIYFADQSFTTLFDLSFISGDNRSLSKPFSAVITASTARKYFGNENPIGKTLRLNCLVTEEFRVAAVIQDLPANTHLDIDVLLSYVTFPYTEAADRADNNWGNETIFTYVRLADGADIHDLRRKIDEYAKKSVATDDNEIDFTLQPVRDIHLQSGVSDEIKPGGNPLVGRFLLIAAAFILVLAWINYTNLTTARVFQRAKEVGMRKISGAFKRDIFVQFITESLMVNTIALCLSVAMVQGIAPSFIRLMGTGSVFSLSVISLPFYLLLLFFFLGVLISGGYAAFIMSSGNPVALFKGSYHTIKKNAFQQGLVTLQFVVSISLIIGTVVVFTQLSFMRSQDLGIAINHTLLIRTPTVVDTLYTDHLQHFKSDLLANSHIQHVTTSAIIPGSENTWMADVARNKNGNEKSPLAVNIVDSDYIDAFEVKILSGRNFLATEQRKTKFFGETLERVMLNEAATTLLGYPSPSDAVNQNVYWNDNECIVVGVVNNFHQRSLHHAVQPSIFILDNQNSVYYSVKFNASSLTTQDIIALVRKRYDENFPGNPFDYFFLEESFDAQYRTDEQFGTVFGAFSALTIVIACLGLYGLVSYNVIQRTREIGIRKILGAGVFNLQSLLLQRYLKLTLIAFILAVPITYFMCNEWLNTFAYHISPSLEMFVVPGGIVIIMALLSVCIQSMKASLANPIDSLRTE